MTWTYVPIVGNFSEGGIVLKDDAVDFLIPRSADPAYQGKPRPGRLKWFFQITSDAPITGSQQTLNFIVPTPFKFTQADVDKGLNALLPVVVVSPGGPPGPVATVFVYEANVADQTIRIEMYFVYPVPQPATTGQYYVLIDFAHSIAN
jgi:hypothetical protein